MRSPLRQFPGCNRVVAACGGVLMVFVALSVLAACRGSTTAQTGSPTGSGLAAGAGHTCALSNGTIKCWGSNSAGQLGIGTTTNASTPVAVTGINTATAVTAGAGGDHTCARLTDGTLVCWGQNEFGQLGNGALVSSTTPVAVTGVTTAAALTAGTAHACALLANATIQCWGSNAGGQLGTATSFGSTSSTPVTVTGITTATAIAAGGDHTCAVLADGTVRCWGKNDAGQLGVGFTGTPNALPQTVTGIHDEPPVATVATAVTAGAGHTCALLLDATVKCWGSNSKGQLGTATAGSSPTPASVTGLSAVVALVAGNSHTCARFADSTLKCWGAGSSGQRGDGTTLTSVTSPTFVSGVSTATTVAAGGFHTCARLSDGTLKCWGANNSGQLGNGTLTDSSTPVFVAGSGF